MDFKIGAKIIEFRKQKKMTQEQLANILGVSAPAVSKWETDSSYPDITMLCPLARALGTDVDTLLSYEETLSEEKQGQYMTEIIGMLREGNAEEAEGRLEQLLHSYPSSVSLKFSAVAAFSLMEMTAANNTAGEPDNQKKAHWRARKKELAEAIYESGDSAFYLPAISMLVSLELAEDHLDRAEELLKKTITNTADFTMLWVQLYQKRGEKDKALGTVQRNLYKLIGEVRACILTLLEDNMELNLDRTAEICDIFEKQEELFGVGNGMGHAVIAEVCLRLGREEKAIEHLEMLAEHLTGQPVPPNPALFFPAFSPETTVPLSEEFRQITVTALKQDACYEPLRGTERFQRILERIG